MGTILMSASHTPSQGHTEKIWSIRLCNLRHINVKNFQFLSRNVENVERLPKSVHYIQTYLSCLQHTFIISLKSFNFASESLIITLADQTLVDITDSQKKEHTILIIDFIEMLAIFCLIKNLFFAILSLQMNG